MDVIKLSKKSLAAVSVFKKLYDEGKVFVAKGDPEVQRTCEVYLAACSIADEIGKDMAKHIGAEPLDHGKYEIISNMKMIIRRRVGGHNGKPSGYCAVSIYDFDERTSRYVGVVKC